MVGRQALDLLVGVRIPLSQPAGCDVSYLTVYLSEYPTTEESSASPFAPYARIQVWLATFSPPCLISLLPTISRPLF